MSEEKIYRNADGHIFNPDPMREIPLAAQVILALTKEDAGDGNLTVDERMQAIRQSALRIIDEINVLKTK